LIESMRMQFGEDVNVKSSRQGRSDEGQQWIVSQELPAGSLKPQAMM
jgi:hypothetical protein